MSVRPCVRACVRPSDRLSVHAYVPTCVRLAVCPSDRPCLCVSVRPSDCPCLRVSVWPSVRPSVRAYLCPCVWPSVRPCLRVSLFGRSCLCPCVCVAMPAYLLTCILLTYIYEFIKILSSSVNKTFKSNNETVQDLKEEFKICYGTTNQPMTWPTNQ